MHLGDYVDRGLDSQGVLDALLKYLSDFRLENRWFPIGGDATVLSYGVRIPKGL